ncbi:P-loop NTPase family protein [Halorarum salinum]|uniref:ParA family protein n=1 Tax=Halorarum salinum TaxID=2743089 RepID=A0A7D5QIG2_9EURY|nr:ParA family protein [Halobaculum salinum]QLG60685.1 ParA family protein [Halobaculum salinum]
MIRTLALVGVAGGVGTTRTAVECAAILALDGRDVAVLDAAYATQGLSEYLPGRVDPDLTDLCLHPERPLADGLHDLEIDAPDRTAGVDSPDRLAAADAPGRVALAPALAPFERLARAKTVEAAESFEDRVAEAAAGFDCVLVDVPPVAANQHVAAVNAVDRVGLVVPGSERGADARRRTADRLRDVGVDPDRTLSVGTDLPAAAATVPTVDAAPAEGPQCPRDGDLAAATAAAVESLFDVELDLEFDDGNGLDRIREGIGGLGR